MCKGDITHTKAVESPEERQILLDGRSVLHTYKNGNNAILAVLCSLFRAEGYGRYFRITLNGIICCRQHLQGVSCSGVRSHPGRRIKRKENTVHSPSDEFREVHVAVFIVYVHIPQPKKLGRGIHMGIVNHYLVLEP